MPALLFVAGLSCSWFSSFRRRTQGAPTVPDATKSHATIHSVTKTLRIACHPRDAFDFLADLGS